MLASHADQPRVEHLLANASLAAGLLLLGGCLHQARAPLDEQGYLHPSLPYRVVYKDRALMPEGWALANYAVRGARLERVRAREHARLEHLDLDGDGQVDRSWDVPRDDLRFVAVDGDGDIWLRHVIVSRGEYEQPLLELLLDPAGIPLGLEPHGFEAPSAQLRSLAPARLAGMRAAVGDYVKGNRRLRLLVARAPFRKWLLRRRPTRRVYSFKVLIVAGATASGPSFAGARRALTELLARVRIGRDQGFAERPALHRKLRFSSSGSRQEGQRRSRSTKHPPLAHEPESSARRIPLHMPH